MRMPRNRSIRRPVKPEISRMNRLIVFCVCMLLMLFSCKKNEQAPDYAGYYGRWQYFGYNLAVGSIPPSPDSVVVLILIPGNTYQTTLNGMPVTRGTFSIDSGTNGTILTFNNITQPAGNDSIVVVGQLTLFQHNHPIIYGDSLVLVQESIAYEYTSDYFKKIP
jgi:hypothetical protein